MQIDIDEK